MKFGCQECELVAKIFRRSEHINHDVDYVFALIAFIGMWTVAGWNVRDLNGVDVASRAGQGECLARVLGVIGARLIKYEHSARYMMSTLKST